MSVKFECHKNWNSTQFRVSLLYECHSNWKTKDIEKVVNPKTSKSAYIGWISIQFSLDGFPYYFWSSPKEAVRHVPDNRATWPMTQTALPCHTVHCCVSTIVEMTPDGSLSLWSLNSVRQATTGQAVSWVLFLEVRDSVTYFGGLPDKMSKGLSTSR